MKLCYNRILCFLLALVMMISLLPPAVFAEPEFAEENSEVQTQSSDTEEPPEEDPKEQPETQDSSPEEELLSYLLELADLGNPLESVHHCSSYYLNTNDEDYRFYMECFNKNGNHTGGVKRQTIIYAYMDQGDIAYFGSSVYNSQVDATETYLRKDSGCDILVTDPNGVKTSYDVIQNGAGHLRNRTQEVNGPRIAEADKNNNSKYIPLCFQAESTGVYTFVFHSVTGEKGTPSSNGAKVKEDAGWGRQANATVAAWDITIVGARMEAAAFLSLVESEEDLEDPVDSVLPEEEEQEVQIQPEDEEPAEEIWQEEAEPMQPESESEPQPEPESGREPLEPETEDEPLEPVENIQPEANADVPALGGIAESPEPEPEPMPISESGEEISDESPVYPPEEEAEEIPESEEAWDEEELLPPAETPQEPGKQTAEEFEEESEEFSISLLSLDEPEPKAFCIYPLDYPEAYEFKTGRVWADYLAMSSGAAGSNVTSIGVYILTDDGYVYKVNFKEIIPFGFIFFANDMGFTYDMTGADGRTTTYSLYHSFYDNDNNLNNMSGLGVNLYRPNPYPGFENPAGANQKIYKVFFEEPAEELRPAIAEPGTVSNLKLVGMQDNVAYFSQGGRFTFYVEGASSVSIEIDLRESLAKSIAAARAAVQNSTTDEQRAEAQEQLEVLLKYKSQGSGVISLNGSVTHGENAFEWDGTDSAGQHIPVGAYAATDVSIVTEAKAGEIHFPIIDAEGFGTEAKPGGLEIIRLSNPSEDSSYIYYNNNPLCYGTIEGANVPANRVGDIYHLSDGTRSRYLGNSSSSLGGVYYFRGLTSRQISTLVEDDKYYLAQHLFGKNYDSLSPEEQAHVNDSIAFRTTYHHEPTPSDQVTMRFYASASAGGGNQAGIDAWAFYSPHPQQYTINSDIAIVDAERLGTIHGKIFYDSNRNTKRDSGESMLRDIAVQLVDENGEPVTHTVRMPAFTQDGYFQRDSDGNVIYQTIETRFRTTTNAAGEYNFTGVPYPKTGSYQYGVQVLLNSVHRDILQYTPTTTPLALTQNNAAMAGYLASGVKQINASSGPDGNRVILGSDTQSGNYFATYPMDEAHMDLDEPECDVSNCQFISMTEQEHYKEFKDIGYVASVPVEFQKNYQVKKAWPEGTKPLSDITVEFYVWDPKEEHTGHTQNGSGLNFRTGLLVDRRKLNAANNWSYTWTQIDSRNQYFFVEYYTKLNEIGAPMYNDREEERLVLIGSTMPIYSSRPAEDQLLYTMKGDNIPYNGHYITEEPKHYFADGLEHPNAVTEDEMQTTVDNNSMLYITTYQLTAADNTLITTFCNEQTYDETEFYVWYNHQRELPNFMHMSHQILNGHEQITPLPLYKADEAGHIKGMVITSMDASFHDNREGNSTDRFTIANDGDTAVLFTADDHIYATGTGTRTYKVEYFCNSDGTPVDVTVNPDGSVSHPNGCQVFSWTMTIHVYDVQPDEVFYYSPFDEEVVLQEALPATKSIQWNWENEEKTVYSSTEPRTREEAHGAVSGSNGVFGNDSYRVPLYKYAVHHLMGTCADLIGIAYSPNGVVSEEEAKNLTYWDTSANQYPERNPNGTGVGGIGTATAYGQGGNLVADLSMLRSTTHDIGQDHINHAALRFLPNRSYDGEEGDVFYYKVMIFSEGISYTFPNYDVIDATRGVEMYTYIRVQPDETLSVTKKLQGNAAEYSQEFHIKVTLTAPEDTIVNKLVEYDGGGLKADGSYRIEGEIAPGWTGSKTIDLVMRRDETVYFHHLTRGMTYTVIEDDYSTLGYFIPRYSFDRLGEQGDRLFTGSAWPENYAAGTVMDMNDTVTVINEKSLPIDVGISTDSAPYRRLLVWAFVTVLLLLPKMWAVPPPKPRRRR